MREIQLTKGAVAIVDDRDFKRVSRYKWRLAENKRTGQRYAISNTGGPHSQRKGLALHSFILRVPPGFEVDHRDRDGLNCRRSNLRKATATQNRQNQKVQRNNRCGFKGVRRDKRTNRIRSYTARICQDGKRISLGFHLTAEEAARAYDAEARVRFGKFARLNFPREGEQGAREI